STSDAFIAKGFLKLFSLNSVMGFLVVGPMLDIKNTLMLFGNFKKTFVLKLIFCIVIISFTVLINFNFS
ncbi:permease, partial [Clostridium butyricum]|uniref:permease n=2 Tax=Clostridium TaxID=1485 RepID=UPI00325C0DC1